MGSKESRQVRATTHGTLRRSYASIAAAVGGDNLPPMAGLTELLAFLKLKNVRTYIQCGNALFESSLKNSKSIRKKTMIRRGAASLCRTPHLWALAVPHAGCGGTSESCRVA